MEQLTEYDPAEDLLDDDAIELFLCDALETANARHIMHALEVVARAKGVSGLAREQLYRSLSENGNPTLETFLAVMKAVGFGLVGRRQEPV